MSNNSAFSSSVIGVIWPLGVAFVVLKLTGLIDWSWWLVTLPFWGGFALTLAIMFILYALWVGRELCKKIRN